MAQSTPFVVLVAALLINILSYCSAENVYCVTPTATSCSSCPHNTHCATLSEYAQEAELYFTSNTTMVFLPGDHALDRTVTVANIARLTMRGESPSDKIATIVRNGSVGFGFTNMVDFNIHSLAFTSHNRSWSYGSHPASSSALFLQSTLHAKLVNCSFQDNLGTALTVHNTSITLAEDNEFIRNQCGCKWYKLGCGITALRSALTFTGNTTFLKNSASLRYSSGAIWASASSLHFTGINNFINNSAQYSGGAILAETNTSLSFSGTSNFSQNSADFGSGGVIFTYSNVLLNFSGTNNFTSNVAKGAGGRGGAIYATNNISLIFIGTSDFSNNSARFTAGAIHIAGDVVLTFNGFNNFINNVAGYEGGAIHTSSNNVLSFIGTNNFISNLAFGDGGAIYISSNSILTFTGTNNFINNSAKFNTVYGGGAISGSHYGNIVLIFNGTNNFINNSADWDGGAINVQNNISLIFIGTSDFVNNSAGLGGGAISVAHNVTLTFNGTMQQLHQQLRKTFSWWCNWNSMECCSYFQWNQQLQQLGKQWRCNLGN